MELVAEMEAKAVKASKFADYVQLVKPRLSFLVVFSAAISFLMATKGGIDWSALSILVVGGFLVTASANGFNQIIEKDLDKLMTRTMNRPLPAERMTIKEAMVFSCIVGVVGIAMLAALNMLSAVLGVFALFSYAFIYTPLKQKTSFSVFVGAIPGAIPAMLGWVAVSNNLDIQAWVLFAIQFVWQFPHFWAIAWVLDEDYKKAGFRMLPAAGKRDRSTAFQTVFYTLVLIPVSLLPMQVGMSGMGMAIAALICGVAFFVQSLYLFKTCSIKAAKSLMFGSFLYLPIVQLAILIDKL